MSLPGLRGLAFGAVDGSLWGAAIEHGPRAIVIGAGDAGAGQADSIEWTDAGDGGWQLRGDGISLIATPLEPATPAPDTTPADDDAPPPPGEPYVPGEGPELCRVHGHLAAGGDFEGLGVRVELAPASSAKTAPGSARLVGAWFPDGAAVALIAARPAREAHQDGDLAQATLFDPDRWTAVGEPRLSTTYDGSGSPARCNLELWIGSGENEFPRRAAGEVSGPGATAATDGLALEVLPLRCHSRGEDGAGVYAVATF